MSLNCNEIDIIIDELNLTGTFVQEIVQPSYDSIAIYTYRPGLPKTLFICLASASCRLHETRRKITKNDKPLRFNEILRSRIKGARITDCRQLGKERIVKISLEKAGPVYVMPKAQEKFQKIQDEKANINQAESLGNIESPDEKYILYVRLWSNAANIFLCDENNQILDSFYRRPGKNEIKGQKFELPDLEKKIDLEYLNEKFPVRTFEEFLEARSESKGSLPEDLSFNQKVDLYYSENAAASSLESLLELAEKWYNSHRSRQQLALERLRSKKEDFLNAGDLKHKGDMILAFSYMVDSARANNSNYIEVEDWENDNKTLRIKIDAKKSAQENAADYYEKYKKSVSGLENLDHDIQMAEKAISQLDEDYAKIRSEKNPVKLEQILRKKQKPKQQEKKNHPGLDYEVSGWQIIVGRDADENDQLLRHNVRGADMWLHVRDYSGGYVFIKNRPGKTVPLEILLYAGNLAVYYSKARKNGSADLYYTQVKHLRRAKNGPKGLVLPTNEKNLFIKLDEKKLRELEEFQK